MNRLKFRKILHRNIHRLYDSLIHQFLTHGAGEQRRFGGEKSIFIFKDQVEIVGIGEKAVFDNEDFIGGAALGEKGIKLGAVEGLVGVDDGVVLYDGEGADGAPLVRAVLDVLNDVGVDNATFGVWCGVVAGDEG